MCLREYFLLLSPSVSQQLKLQVHSISEKEITCVKIVVFYFKIFFFHGFIVLCITEQLSVIKIASITVDSDEVTYFVYCVTVQLY